MMLSFVLAALLQTARLQLGGETLLVEVAQTQEARDQGLMGRTSLAEGNGMLFVFEKPSRLTFWMKNTQIPLSIGFFDQEKKLLNTAEMEPPADKKSPLRVYQSGAPAQYALEAPAGWFKRHEIEPGMKFSFLDPLK